MSTASDFTNPQPILGTTVLPDTSHHPLGLSSSSPKDLALSNPVNLPVVSFEVKLPMPISGASTVQRV